MRWMLLLVLLVIGIVDGELWAHQHVFNAEQLPGLGLKQPWVS